MNKLQKKWVEVLKTTDKPQGDGHLCRDGKYCCLGLAAEFVLEIKPVESAEGILSFDGDEGVLRSYVDLGLIDDIGSINANFSSEFYDALLESGYDKSQCADLAEYNDVGATFKQIAYAIEKVPQAVFVKEQK